MAKRTIPYTEPEEKPAKRPRKAKAAKTRSPRAKRPTYKLRSVWGYVPPEDRRVRKKPRRAG